MLRSAAWGAIRNLGEAIKRIIDAKVGLRAHGYGPFGDATRALLDQMLQVSHVQYRNRLRRESHNVTSLLKFLETKGAVVRELPYYSAARVLS